MCQGFFFWANKQPNKSLSKLDTFTAKSQNGEKEGNSEEQTNLTCEQRSAVTGLAGQLMANFPNRANKTSVVS